MKNLKKLLAVFIVLLVSLTACNKNEKTFDVDKFTKDMEKIGYKEVKEEFTVGFAKLFTLGKEVKIYQYENEEKEQFVLALYNYTEDDLKAMKEEERESVEKRMKEVKNKKITLEIADEKIENEVEYNKKAALFAGNEDGRPKKYEEIKKAFNKQ